MIHTSKYPGNATINILKFPEIVCQNKFDHSQWSKYTIVQSVGVNEVVLLVEIDQMNHTECDSFAPFVLTPDFLKNYQGILFSFYPFSRGTRYVTHIAIVHSTHKCSKFSFGYLCSNLYLSQLCSKRLATLVEK